MFGYIVPNYKELSKEELLRYREYYCGVCSSLRSKNGILGRFSLTYDLTFLSILLTSLYMPQDTLSKERCLPHPLHKHLYLDNEFTRYAADMNILLYYHKLEDNVFDEKNVVSKKAMRLFRDAFERTAALYPKKEVAISDCLERLRKTERSDSLFLDSGANVFAELMREVFILYDDHWKTTLGNMAEALGRFLYVMDAYDDYHKDIKKHRPSPFTAEPQAQDVREMLDLHISECTMYFEMLPLVQDVELLRNILYSGVWTRFDLLNRKKEKNGSV